MLILCISQAELCASQKYLCPSSLHTIPVFMSEQCCINEMAVPWKAVCADVDVGSWSVLSKFPVVNKPYWTKKLHQSLTCAIKRPRKSCLGSRYNSVRETVLPLYLGLLIHGKTRKRELVDVLFRHGLSVSYDCILQLMLECSHRLKTNS